MDPAKGLALRGKLYGGGLAMDANLSASAQKVQDALTVLGYSMQVVELPASTRTAVEAAQAVGCDVGQIVKSLIFKGKDSGRPILILVSGSNRVDLEKAAAAIGEALDKADADFVREHTGFAIGGVPPVGHSEALDTFIDVDLLQYAQVWAAAGTPNAVFCLAAADLERVTGGRVVKIA
jgi:prolyl-tRNA editing enzyme YbaK/EbsC (Cys-tRNA(Pro) deacylase)